MGYKYLDFVKQNFVSEQELMTIHRLQEKIIDQKLDDNRYYVEKF